MEKGIESLQQSIKKDCAEFSPEKLHSEKCRYCPRYFWVLDRAQQYAELTGTTLEEVIKAWEEGRDYWYLNYYQDCNQPDLTKEAGRKVVLFNDWKSQLIEKFGEDSQDWKFICVVCGNIQCGKDFVAIGENPQQSSFNCIGRYTKEKGCDWTLGGFLQIHKTVVLKDLQIFPVFEMA